MKERNKEIRLMTKRCTLRTTPHCIIVLCVTHSLDGCYLVDGYRSLRNECYPIIDSFYSLLNECCYSSKNATHSLKNATRCLTNAT
jgi:hypothetical protein